MEEESKKMSKKQFWTRFSLWILFAVLVPIGFLFYRYDLFVAVHTDESDGYRLTGWGIFSCVLVAIFLLYIVREAKKGMPYGSMFSQCVDGYSALIPVLIMIFILNGIKNNVDAFEQVMIVLFVSEAIAVPINPMRRWAWEHNIEVTGNFLGNVIRKAMGKEDKK
jgi:hypothetical protein